MPLRLPLFPLDVVLFPGAALPLHIFEPRYRQMLADCLDGDGRFGLTPTDPRPGTVGSIAHIRAAQALADGRSNIVVIGEGRFAVRALLEEDTPYLVGSVAEFTDLDDSAPLPTELSALKEVAGRYREALGILGDNPGSDAEWDDDPVAFSFQVAALLESPTETRAGLLGLRSTRERVRQMTTLIGPLLRAVAERAEVHVRARTNGQGGRHHDIVTDR
jgi:ATP-dependent Lon protease